MIEFVKVGDCFINFKRCCEIRYFEYTTLPYSWYKKLRIWYFKRIINKENGRFNELIKIFEKD